MYGYSELEIQAAMGNDPAGNCGYISSPAISGQQGPSYFASAGQAITLSATASPKIGYSYGTYWWETSEAPGQRSFTTTPIKTLTLNNVGTTTVSVTPVLQDGTACSTTISTIIVQSPVCISPQTLQGGVCVTPTVTAQFSDDFNGAAIDTSKWISIPCHSAGDPMVGGGLIHFDSCQSADTHTKVSFSGQKIVIEVRFQGPKSGGRDTAIALVNAATGDFFQFGDTDYESRGVYAYLYYGGVYEFVQAYGGTTTAFKEYRVTIEGQNVMIQRGDSLSNLTESYTATLPRSATNSAYYLRIGTGASYYAPADFDWIRVATY